MNVNEIAKKLLAMRENRMSGFIMAGQVREELGYEGYGEALRLRWIEPDMDQSGMVTITNHLGKVAEIRQAALESKCKCPTGDCKCGCKDGACTCESVKESVESSPGAHFFAQAHAFRRNRVVGENAAYDPDMEEFYASRRPELRTHWSKHPQHAAYPPEEMERKWGEFEPQLRSHLHQNFFSPGGHHHHNYQAWRRGRGQQAPAAPVAPPHDVEIGVNDSLIEKLMEVATLGLGRTGEAPTTPVVGLGAQSAAPAPASSSSPAPLPRPFPAQSQPGSTAQAPMGIGSDVGVVENGRQYTGKISRTLPDGKFEISFAGDHPGTNRPYDKTEISAVQAK